MSTSAQETADLSPASPWAGGSVLFRLADGTRWLYDPTGGSTRPRVIDLFVAPPGAGKSMLANTINLGLCLGSAALGDPVGKLPLIGKIDIGRSAEGFVRLIQEALEAQFGVRRISDSISSRLANLSAG